MELFRLFLKELNQANQEYNDLVRQEFAKQEPNSSNLEVNTEAVMTMYKTISKMAFEKKLFQISNQNIWYSFQS